MRLHFRGTIVDNLQLYEDDRVRVVSFSGERVDHDELVSVSCSGADIRVYNQFGRR